MSVMQDPKAGYSMMIGADGVGGGGLNTDSDQDNQKKQFNRFKPTKKYQNSRK